MIRISLLILIVFALCACNSNKDRMISKKNSVEIILETKHLNQEFDLLITKRNVYIDENIVRNYISIDTIPALGNVKVEDQNSRIPNQYVAVPKEYEIYVTIK